MPSIEAPPAPAAPPWREIAQRLRELAEKAPPSINYIEGPRSNLVHVETGERHPDGLGVGLFSVPKKHIAYIDLFYELLENLPTILDALSTIPPGSPAPPPPEPDFEAMVEALKPFAAWAKALDRDFADHADDVIAGGLAGHYQVTFGDLRRARAVLRAARLSEETADDRRKL